MRPSDFYLCYLKVLSQPELDLVHAYWEFGDSLEEYKYKSSDRKFRERTAAISNISSKAGKYAYLASKKLGCSVCGEKFQVLSRTKLQKLLDKRPEKCHICFENEINEMATELLAQLEQCLSALDLPVSENVTSYNYLDTLFTFIILHEDCHNDTGRVTNPDKLNLTGSHEHDIQIITDLVAKNILYEIDKNLFSENSFFDDGMTYLRRHLSYLNSENRVKYHDLILKTPVSGYYVAKPDQFEDHSILMNFLFERILNMHIDLDDIKLLEELVDRTLLHKAYQLIPIVESDHRITVERSLRLESVLLYGVKHFPLTQVFNVLYYNGRLTAADIHSKPSIHRILHQKNYIKNVENQLIRLENVDEEKRYKRYLPKNILDSKVEIYSSRYFLEDVMSWASLSGKEVVKRWLNEHSMLSDDWL